jgi:shikimate kinase
MMTAGTYRHEDVIAASGHALAQSRFVARSVVLVGFMGVGKTSVGTELARLLERSFVDTDPMVEQRSGRSIPELFAEGESVFRTVEREAVRTALQLPPCVIALGGGAFSQPGAAELIRAQALVVHLYTPWGVLRHRLAELAVDRPMVRDRQPWQVQDLFLQRMDSYRKAHVRVSLPRHSVSEAAVILAAVLRRPAADGDGAPGGATVG